MVQTRKVGLLPDLYLHKEHEWVILFIQYILLSEQHSENFDENLVFWDKIEIWFLLISWFETRTKIFFIQSCGSRQDWEIESKFLWSSEKKTP